LLGLAAGSEPDIDRHVVAVLPRPRIDRNPFVAETDGLLLLAMSCVLTREPQQLKTAATRAIVLTGMLMTAAFASQEFAGQTAPNPMLADKWPALMAWLPIFLFGPMSVILLDKVKT